MLRGKTYPSDHPFIYLFLPNSVAAPDLLDPKAAAHNSKPRLSFSAKPVVLNTQDDFEPRISVMRWKTVLTVFLLVVLYLIMGAMVFKALEQPRENSQKLAILSQKLQFLIDHPCVNSTELEELVKVRQGTHMVTHFTHIANVAIIIDAIVLLNFPGNKIFTDSPTNTYTDVACLWCCHAVLYFYLMNWRIEWKCWRKLQCSNLNVDFSTMDSNRLFDSIFSSSIGFTSIKPLPNTSSLVGAITCSQTV